MKRKTSHSRLLILSLTALLLLLPFVSSAQDADGDGMPDSWEDIYPCVDSLVGDSVLDPDTDGLSNIQEYMAGANPCDEDTDDDLMPGGLYRNCA
jgi:hypothetical protein